MPPKVKVCQACGFELKPKANVRVVDGKLVEHLGSGHDKFLFSDDPQFEEKETFYRELIGYAQERGYKYGWAFHQYRARYNENPDKKFANIAAIPSTKTRNWLKHVWIKRNKAKAKAMGGWR